MTESGMESTMEMENEQQEYEIKYEEDLPKMPLNPMEG